MIKTTYFCDCCKQVIPDDADHIQMVPMNETVDVFTGALSGYEKMVDAHFCRACTDRIISFMFQPVDITALEASIKEDQDIIATLNAELEEARKALGERTTEQTTADPTDESDLPSPGSAKVKQRMTGKRSPVDKQQVIRLYRDNHMTYQQIADSVGCAVSTVYGIVSKYNRSAPAPTESAQAEETNE